MSHAANWSLKEAIREHWSARAATFDDAFGHRIPPGRERDAWARVIRDRLGAGPHRVLELASGTGEVTGVLVGLGHDVTGIDFSEAMIARSRSKHRGEHRARFVLADAESTMQPDGAFDAVVCRHLVWTLTDPAAALADWHRALRPGGQLLVFDGDFVNLPPEGRLARSAISLVQRWSGPDTHRAPELDAQHAAILGALPFREGLAFEALREIAAAAGFATITRSSHAPIARAQRRTARGAQDWLRTWLYRRFVLHAVKPGG